MIKKPDNWKFWILLALTIKAVILFFLLITSNGIGSLFHSGFKLIHVTSDTATYFDPIDNLLSQGSYSPDFRMPGYGAFYLIFRLILSIPATYKALIILQYILASISVYYLALMAKELFNNNGLFYIVFFIYITSTFITWFDVMLITESLCISLMIFSMYFIIKYAKSGNIWSLLLTGTLLTWVTFIRPNYAPLLPCFIVIALLYKRKESKSILFKHLVLFSLPFIIIDGAWAFRNYRIYKKIMPLTDVFVPAYRPMATAIEFVKSWGGNYHPFSTNSQVCWFGYSITPLTMDTATFRKSIRQEFRQPLEGSLGRNYLYTSAFNYDSLLHLKVLISQMRNSGIKDTVVLNKMQNEIDSRFIRYTLSVKKEKPYLYYIKARLMYLEILLTNANASVFSYFIQLLGLVGMFIIFFKGIKGSVLPLILVVPFTVMIVAAIVLRLDEGRYMAPEWPFTIVCAGYTILVVFTQVRKILT